MTSLKNETSFTSFTGLIPKNDPNNGSRFVTAGIDYEPVKNVHFMPNVWLNRYQNNTDIQVQKDIDLAYRLTFFYEFEE